MPEDIHYRDAVEVIKILESAGFAARMAGGCVRDRQLNQAPKDYDIATTALPVQVTELFAQKMYKVIPTGIDHGTVTVVMPAGNIEITTLRHDLKTDGRHAEVIFGRSFEEDAARRDFTINALFEDADGKIYDYFNGLQHLTARELHFVGDPDTRIKEDYLRIMRFFRFWGRFRLKPDPQGLTAIKKEMSGLKRVSQERITGELLGLLDSEEPNAPLKVMQDVGLLKMLLETLADPLPLPAIKELSEELPAGNRAVPRLSLLLPDLSLKEVEKKAKALRLSNQQLRLLQSLVCDGAGAPPPAAQKSDKMAFIDDCEERVGEGLFLTVLVPTWKKRYPALKETWQHLAEFEKNEGLQRKAPLPLSGSDLLAAGFPPGPKLGGLLSALKAAFRDGRWATRDEGLALARILNKTNIGKS